MGGEVTYPIGVPADVCDKFEELALDLARGNSSVPRPPFKRYSSDAILHRIRWHFRIERGHRAFKCNDHWTAPLARWFLEQHPEFEGFFELRERVSDGYEDEQKDAPAAHDHAGADLRMT